MSAAPLSTQVSVSTDPAGNAVTVTQTLINTQSQSAPTATATASGGFRSTTNGFLQNKAAMGAVFTIIGLVAAGVLFWLV
ncbi:hypothetical protein B0H17DRAFT_1070364, partial [Mycena rosella]